MEQYLMEGSFHKVFLSKGNVPSERYNYFIDILLDATRYVRILHALWNRRDEVASCIEAAYEELSVSEATKTLFFSKAEQMKAYAKQVSRYMIILRTLFSATGHKLEISMFLQSRTSIQKAHFQQLIWLGFCLTTPVSWIKSYNCFL